MEALGGVSSVITILDLSWKVKSLQVSVKDAPADWERYCNGLQAVASIGNAIESMRLNYPETNKILIPTQGSEKPKPLLEHLNEALHMRIAEAKKLLDAYSPAKNVGNLLDAHNPAEFIDRFLELFGRMRFVLARDRIQTLINGVEATRQQLHMTLTMVSLQTETSWRREASDVLRTITNHMEKHLEVLERLQHSTPPLDNVTVPVEIEQTTGQGGAEALAWKSLMRSSINHIRRRGNLKKKHGDPVPQSSQSPRPLECSADLSVEHGDDGDAGDWKDDNDADGEESEIDEEPCSLAITAMARDGVFTPDHEHDYGILLVDTELVQVPVDSDIYQSAIASGGSYSSPPLGPVTPMAPIRRLEEVLDTFSDEEWDGAKYLPAEELMGFLTSARPTAYATDVEMIELDQSSYPIAISSHMESFLLISETVDLDLCRRDGGSSRDRNFCIDHVSISKNTQTFRALEPCTDHRAVKCQHLTLLVSVDGYAFRGKPPGECIKLTSLTIGEPVDNELECLSGQQSETGVIVLDCNGGRRGRRVGEISHCHTVIDKDGRTACAFQTRLFASLETPFGESHAGTERAPSDVADGAAVHTGGCEGQHVAGDDPGLPDIPGRVDNGPALEWLRMMALDDTYEPPESIELGALIRFLTLVDEHREYGGQKALKQARVWASMIQTPDFLNEDDMPQLWVLWKLGMEAEFKTLSAAIQQHARSPLSQWQGGPRNEHGIRLPGRILEKLDNGRSQALSTVRDKIAEEIEKQRRTFADSIHAGVLHDYVTGFPFRRSPIGDVLRSSFTFGYLQLQVDRFLEPWRSGQDSSDPDIPGLSFVDVVRCVLSMLELDGWSLCEVPGGIRTPSLLEKATVFGVPILLGAFGVHMPTPIPSMYGLHSGHRMCVPLDRGFKAELVRLIQQLEQEEWGVDINEIEE